jgi:hypothetical protein
MRRRSEKQPLGGLAVTEGSDPSQGRTLPGLGYPPLEAFGREKSRTSSPYPPR